MRYSKELEQDLKVCRACGHHFRLSARERIALTADEGTFVERDAGLHTGDPLEFPGYDKKLREAEVKTAVPEALLWGECVLGGVPAVLGAMEHGFIMGSMGSVVGEKVCRAAERAVEARLPLALFCCSGGARMQEGIISLLQMAKTAAAIARLHRTGLPYICVAVDPLTAGVFASFASLGDINLAEPGAIVQFAGPRVIAEAFRVKTPAGPYLAEFQLEHGMIDLIVPRREMKSTIAKLLGYLA